MKAYTLKSVIRRGAMFGAAFAIVAATVAPAAQIHADELNPLTDRSLTLSSGSPGWAATDGSGNSTYAPPNSGANGKKTGNTFEFKVSSDSTTNTIKGMTFQYCTKSAGDCLAPGNNGWVDPGATAGNFERIDNADLTATDKKSDLEIVTASPTEADFATFVNASTGQVIDIPDPAVAGSNFMVYYRTSDGGTPLVSTDDTWAASTGWSMTAEEAQYGVEADGESTGTLNQIKLTKTAGQGFTAGQMVKVVFFGTEANYITNPGADAFFVKINTYNSTSTFDQTTLVDGGVTVANVMNESIQITTKVLETMDFSVGTVDPYTLASTGAPGSQLFLANGKEKHGVCDPILKGMTPAAPANTLQMGDALGEFSLETARTYSTHSYWRLSSNSSAGATVYYSGVTLSNTVGDKIAPIGVTAEAPSTGSEQFGLAIASAAPGTPVDPDTDGDGDPLTNPPSPLTNYYTVDYTTERGSTFGDNNGKNLENGADNATAGIHSSVTDDAISNIDDNDSWHAPQLYPLIPTANYGAGGGVVNANYAAATTPIDTAFAFDETSQTIPVAIATEDAQVVDCVTAKMRYIANIAATTPAGIYTTKINYIAAPQY